MQELFRIWGQQQSLLLNEQGAQDHEAEETVGICAQAGSQGAIQDGLKDQANCYSHLSLDTLSLHVLVGVCLVSYRKH